MAETPFVDIALVAAMKADRAWDAVKGLTSTVEGLKSALSDLQRAMHPLRAVAADEDLSPFIGGKIYVDAAYKPFVPDQERIVAKFESWVEEHPFGVTLTLIEVTYTDGGGDRVTRLWDKGAKGLTRAQFASAMAGLARQCGAPERTSEKDVAFMEAFLADSGVLARAKEQVERQNADLQASNNKLLERARAAEQRIETAMHAAALEPPQGYAEFRRGWASACRLMRAALVAATPASARADKVEPRT